MRAILILVFGSFFLLMVGVTVRASLETSVFDVPQVVLQDKWFQATLVDAYLGFLTFFVWVYFRESGWGSRTIWFVLIMSLGNMAMSAYVLWAVVRLPAGAGPRELLLGTSRREAALDQAA